MRCIFQKDKLAGIDQPYFGLGFIEEILSFSKAEMEPHYFCKLCAFQGDSGLMMNHLFSKDHSDRFTRESPSEVKVDKDNGKFELIKTIYSDELYPWPLGQEPWSIERGKFFSKVNYIIK